MLGARLEVPFVAVLGLTAYRAAFGVPDAVVGPQSLRLGAAQVWVLPNTSGLNASWQLPRLAAAFRDLLRASR